MFKKRTIVNYRDAVIEYVRGTEQGPKGIRKGNDMKRKGISLLLAAILFITPGIPAFGETGEKTGTTDTVIVNSGVVEKSSTADAEATAKITKDEAKAIGIKILKKYFKLVIDDKNYQCNIQLMPDYLNQERYVWSLNWNSVNALTSISAGVTIDSETGTVTGFNKYEYNGSAEPMPVAKTEAEAKKIAIAFIKKINPTEYKQTQYIADTNYYSMGMYREANYNFRFVRKINGILYENNAITVTVDGRTGSVTNYSFNWSDASKFATAEGIVSKADALKKFKENPSVKLAYIAKRTAGDYQSKVTEAKLIYQISSTYTNFVDAKSGELVDWNGIAVKAQKELDLTAVEKEALLKDIKPRENLAKELDADQAKELAVKYGMEIFGETYEAQSASYSDGANSWSEGRGSDAWSVQLVRSGYSYMGFGGNIVLNADTGALIACYMYNPMMDTTATDEEFVPKITWEEAYRSSIDMLKKYFPEKLGEVNTKQTQVDNISYIGGKKYMNRNYYFTFERIVNGIPYAENNVNISFDAATGKVTNLGSAWDMSMKFPSVAKVVSEEKATANYFKEYEPVLCYQTIFDQEKNTQNIVLAYAMRDEKLTGFMANIDALTGNFIDYFGQPIKKATSSFDKAIKGSKYEKALKILAFQGVIEKDSFSMKKEIKKSEFIKMLVTAKGYGYYGGMGESLRFTNMKVADPYYRYLQSAVSMGLVENKKKEFDMKEKMTREEMAELVVKYLKYDRLAKAKNIYVLDYKDRYRISKGSYNSVALCTAIGVFPDSDYFRPKDNVTMLEAAVAIYYALGSRGY